MSTLIIILLIAGIAYLAIFHKPQNHSVAELKSWFSNKLSEIADQLEEDIKKDKKGEYVHAGKQSFEKRGEIVYILRDKNYARFDISDKNDINVDDILETEGYSKLTAKTQSLSLSMRLDEITVEGDEAESFGEIDEYIDDIPRYYTISISGW